MAFVDEYDFEASAGAGGDGVVRWRREKFVPKGGPNGGDGGKGGDVYLEAVRDTTMLHRVVHVRTYRAQPGEPGADSSKTGADGRDLVIPLPLGSIVTERTRGTTLELLTEGERVLVLRGGAKGLGNEHFKSSTNQRPMQCTKGQDGERGVFHVELRLIADIGFVGLPNAGKTSLLNALTRAGAKVGDYPFTTLDPNLGAYHGFVLADIPGLIEGAHEGKGLGHNFLRHIARTRSILHIISLERDNIANDYKTIKHELDSYPGLGSKQHLIVLSKTDTVPEGELSERISAFERETGERVYATVSVLDDASVKHFADTLVRTLRDSRS